MWVNVKLLDGRIQKSNVEMYIEEGKGNRSERAHCNCTVLHLNLECTYVNAVRTLAASLAILSEALWSLLSNSREMTGQYFELSCYLGVLPSFITLTLNLSYHFSKTFDAVKALKFQQHR
jgi:hypothetical protein